MNFGFMLKSSEGKVNSLTFLKYSYKYIRYTDIAIDGKREKKGREKNVDKSTSQNSLCLGELRVEKIYD